MKTFETTIGDGVPVTVGYEWQEALPGSCDPDSPYVGPDVPACADIVAILAGGVDIMSVVSEGIIGRLQDEAERNEEP